MYETMSMDTHEGRVASIETYRMEESDRVMELCCITPVHPESGWCCIRRNSVGELGVRISHLAQNTHPARRASRASFHGLGGADSSFTRAKCSLI